MPEQEVRSMRRCAVPACAQPPTARGWCIGHYTRWLRTGDVRADEPLQSTAEPRACAVDGCSEPATARGWCQMHYQRWRRSGTVRAAEPKRGAAQRVCAVDGCERPVDARALCHGHYQRLLRTGDLQPAVPLARRKQPRVCTVLGCTRATHAQGLCRTHHKRLDRHGDVRAEIPVRLAEGQGWLSHGYRYVPVPATLRHLTNGEPSIAEHRLIMAIHLDRPLRRDEVVHHVNGVKTDNRIDNLELWTTYHPKGQRIPDKVAFAVELLRRYRPDLLRGAGEGSEAAP
jgi:hypothetical protein